jgi:VanZ family protein
MNLSRAWWGLGGLLSVTAAVVCLVPMQQVHSGFDMNDKVSHLIGHGTLAAYFAGLVPRHRWWKIFVLLLLFGILVEFAQYYMNLGRNGDARDVIANACGATLGLLAARLGVSRWPDLAAWLLGRRGEAG